MESATTTVLDAVGLLALAAGVGFGVAQWIGWWGLAVAGVIVLTGSALADRLQSAGRT